MKINDQIQILSLLGNAVLVPIVTYLLTRKKEEREQGQREQMDFVSILEKLIKAEGSRSESIYAHVSWLEQKNVDLMKEYLSMGNDRYVESQEFIRTIESLEREKAEVQGELREVLLKWKREEELLEKLEAAIERLYEPMSNKEKLNIVRKKLGSLINDEILLERFGILDSQRKEENENG